MTDPIISMGNHLVDAGRAQLRGDAETVRYHARHIKQLCDVLLEADDE